MTDKIDELMRLATALPAASCGSNANYIEAVERLRTALEAALKDCRNATLEEAAVIVMESAYRSNGTSSYEHVAQKIRSLKT